MDYQLQQTGPEVQGILNQAPGVITIEALNTVDTTSVFYVKNEEDDVAGLFFCYEGKDDYDRSYYTQVLLFGNKIFMRAGQLPLTDQWIDYNQMAIDGKVDKRTGYGLSKNDFTDYYKGTIEALMRDVARLTDGKLGWEFVAELPAISYNTLNKVYFIQSTVDANCVDAWIADTSVTPNAWKQIGKSIDTSVFYQKPSNGIPKTDLASAVQSSLENADTAVQPAALTPIQNAINTIEAVIPSAASAQNQLADKNYVDTHSSDIDVDDALSTTSENPVQNKVVTTALNGKQATISDLSTIRSGAAAGATAVQPATMNTALAAKQDTLTFDNAPTANSNNPVKSGGVKTAIDAKQDTISTVNVTVDNNTGTPSGSASVSGGTLSLSFQNLKGATGAQGPQGIQGVQGVQGPKGDTGVTGDASSLAIIHGIDKTSSYGTTDVCGADAAQALLNEIEGGFYY
jgi:hypothetical protein